MRVALIQMAVSADKSATMQRIGEFISMAKQRGAEVIVLPESFNCPYSLGLFAQYAEAVPKGVTCQVLSRLALSNKVWIIGGTIPEKDAGHIFNTCPVFDPQGRFVGRYRKMHLFDIDIPGKIAFKESEVMSAGNRPFSFQMGDFKVGLGVCYDLRFPELALAYSHSGVNVLMYPGAFNTTTGPKHWQMLQQARAHDTQSYVLTCSPARSPNATADDYPVYGHTMVVGPDGTVLGEIKGDQEEILLADLVSPAVEDSRKSIPILTQKRADVFQLTVNDIADI